MNILDLKVTEDTEVTKLEQGDTADEAYQARQVHEEELFTRMKCREEDLKAQEQRKWGGGDPTAGIKEKEKRRGRSQEVCSFPEN